MRESRSSGTEGERGGNEPLYLETSMTRFFDTQADDYTFRANVEL